MRIELKNIKHSPSLSEETAAFSATVFIDGKKAGVVSNHGTGGGNEYAPWSLAETLTAYAKTLPPIVDETLRDPHDASKPFTYAPNADTVIGDLFDAWLAAKDEARLRRKFESDYSTRMIWLKADGVYVSKKVTPEQLQKALPASVAKATSNGEVVLNALPLEEAWAKYRAAVVTV